MYRSRFRDTDYYSTKYTKDVSTKSVKSTLPVLSYLFFFFTVILFSLIFPHFLRSLSSSRSLWFRRIKSLQGTSTLITMDFDDYRKVVPPARLRTRLRHYRSKIGRQEGTISFGVTTLFAIFERRNRDTYLTE